MNSVFRHLGLTGRILISFWLTLVFVGIAMTTLLVYQRDSHEQKEIPPVKISDQLVVKLLSQPFDDVAMWFSQQPRNETKRVFITYQGQEILDRKLPRILKRFNKKLSVSRPFIHKRRGGHIAVGRRLLLPNGQHTNLLIKAKDFHPPMLQILTDSFWSILGIVVLISGLISFLLARFITKPIILLRQATQKLADGDLSIRITPDLKKSQDESYLLAHDFDKMAQKLERTISSQKHLIQDISHELRSPVARLQLALELAQKKLDISDDQRDIQRIKKEISQINSIINTLLNLPAYELDPQLALTDYVDIEEVLNTIIDDLNYTQPAKHIQLQSQLKQPVILNANQQLLCSAFENVLKNAQHYHNSTDNIEVVVRHFNQTLEIRCMDLGPGIPEDKLQEIFKPFYRLDSARERSSGGHGLGLAISKRAIELHQGHISAHGRQDKGLCISISLPCNPT
jgi:two-component system sensor histidine kinase CpxA